jgi:hypothetical protein
MELAILAGVTSAGVAGYLMNQEDRKKNFNISNSLPTNQVGLPSPGFPNVYDPMGNPVIMNYGPPGLMGPRTYMTPMGPMPVGPSMSPMPMPVGPVGPVQNGLLGPRPSINPNRPNGQISNGPLGPGSPNILGPYQYKYQNPRENFANVQGPVPVQQPSAIQLFMGNTIGPQQPQKSANQQSAIQTSSPTAMDGRPFVHNNMVPFFKGNAKQNMFDTGVSQTDNYGQINTGYDKSTPYQTPLNTYTGINENWMHKRETGPMFSPAEQQTNWVYGTPLFRPEKDRYSNTDQPNYKDMAPVQPIQVGPGLNLDPSIPATGGLHEFTRVMPNNITDYKANQLENRINAGKLVSAGLPSAYPGVGGSMNISAPGVPKNKPPKDWSMTRYPVMSNKIGIVKNFAELRSDYTSTIKPNNAQREQISYGYGTVLPNGSYAVPQGSASSNALRNDNKDNKDNKPCVEYTNTIGIAPSRPSINLGNRSPTYMSQDNNIRSVSDCNSFPVGAPSPDAKVGPIVSNYYVNETDRGSLNPANASQLNLKGPDATTFYTYNDVPKTSTRETTNFAYSGDASRPKMGATFYTYTDDLKTTNKETTEFSYSGDASRENMGSTFYTYTDKPKTSNKETVEFAYAGDASKPSVGSAFYTYKDGLRSTVKQSTNFSYAGDPTRASNGQKFYTFSDAPRSTIKQSTNFSYAGNVDTGKSKFIESSRFQFTGVEAFSNVPYRNVSSVPPPAASLKGPKGPQGVKGSQNALGEIDYNKLKSNFGTKAYGGADTYTLRSTTLVQEYFPGPGRSNIRQDADDLIGESKFNAYSNFTDGPGTFSQAIPDGSRFQNNRFLAVPTFAPNKIVGEDNRQIASYQNSQLKKNPLSIYTNDPDAKIPTFMADTNPTDYSDFVTQRDKDLEPLGMDVQNSKQTAENVYPPDENVLEISNINANANVVYNTNTENDYNPFISQGSSAKLNNPIKFEGHAYSGRFENNPNPPTGSDSVSVFGPDNTIDSDGQCKPNPALDYGLNTLVINDDKYFAE